MELRCRFYACLKASSFPFKSFRLLAEGLFFAPSFLKISFFLKTFSLFRILYPFLRKSGRNATTKLSNVTTRLSNVLTKLSNVTTRLSYVLTRLSNVTTRLSNVTTKLSYGATRLSNILTKISYVTTRLSNITTKLSYVATRLSFTPMNLAGLSVGFEILYLGGNSEEVKEPLRSLSTQ
jgi:hypothetical protein